jgi:signal peptidase I
VIDETLYADADTLPPEAVAETKWQLFSFGALSSVIPGAGHFFRGLRRRGLLWFSAFVLFLVGLLVLEPWQVPDYRIPAFLLGAAILCGAGIDAAFADTEEGLRPALWVIVIFAAMSFIASYSVNPLVWRLGGYRLYSGTGNAMQPKVHWQDRVVADTHAYRHTQPRRGEVVVYGEFAVDLFHSRARLGRIIAIPGDTMEEKNGQIVLNGIPVKESYIGGGSASIDVSSSSDEGLRKLYNFGPVKLGPGEYFVMGDNRGLSIDSRQEGPIKLSDIRGKALYLLSGDDDRDGKRLN